METVLNYTYILSDVVIRTIGYDLLKDLTYNENQLQTDVYTIAKRLNITPPQPETANNRFKVAQQIGHTLLNIETINPLDYGITWFDEKTANNNDRFLLLNIATTQFAEKLMVPQRLLHHYIKSYSNKHHVSENYIDHNLYNHAQKFANETAPKLGVPIQVVVSSLKIIG